MIDKYPIDPNDPVVFWGRTKKNYYWGHKAGGKLLSSGNPNSREYQFGYKIKKWGNGDQNSGPSGYKAKKAKRGRI